MSIRLSYLCKYPGRQYEREDVGKDRKVHWLNDAFLVVFSIELRGGGDG